MTIEEIKVKLDKSNLDSDTLIELTRYLDGYQKIEQIVKTWDDDENAMILADKIREVIEDGNDN